MSTYQILGGSGWPQVMKSAIESTDMTSVIYFYSLLFLGNVVLYNLFVAVIIVAFIRQKTTKSDAQRADRMPFLAVYRPQHARVKRGLFGRLSALAKRAMASILLCMHAVFPWIQPPLAGADQLPPHPSSSAGHTGAGLAEVAANGGAQTENDRTPVKSSDKKRTRREQNRSAVERAHNSMPVFAHKVACTTWCRAAVCVTKITDIRCARRSRSVSQHHWSGASCGRPSATSLRRAIVVSVRRLSMRGE